MNLQDFKANKEYILCKNTPDDISKNETNDIKVRSKCDWYEQRKIHLILIKLGK